MAYPVDASSWLREFIASQLRDVAAQHGWERFDVPASDPAFPPALRLLKPWGVWSFPDYAELEFGDIGLRAFRPGLAGYGTRSPITTQLQPACHRPPPVAYLGLVRLQNAMSPSVDCEV